MVLADAPIGSACCISQLPETTYTRERGLKVGTTVKVISRSSYGTMRVQLQEGNQPELLVRTLVAETINVVEPEPLA